MEETKETDLTKPKNTELQEISTLVYVNLVNDVKSSHFEIFKMLEYTYRKFTDESKILFNTKLTNKKYNNPYILIIVAEKDIFTKYISNFYKRVGDLSYYERFFQCEKIIFLDPKAENTYNLNVKEITVDESGEFKEGKDIGPLDIECGNISLSKNAEDTLKNYSLYDKNYPNINIENDKGITVYWNGLNGNFNKKKQIKKYNVIPNEKRNKNKKYFEMVDLEDKTEAAPAAGGKTRKHRKRKMRSSKRKASKKGRKSRKKNSSSKKKK